MAGGVMFLRSVPAHSSQPWHAILQEARRIVSAGSLGRVRFCRVGDSRHLAAVRFILEDTTPACIMEVHKSTEAVALLGSHATLVVNQTGCQVFTRNS